MNLQSSDPANPAAPAAMPDSGIFARIRATLDSLSRAERRVGEYLLQQPHTALEMPIGQLARACGVSEPTVARYARSLGFEGLRSFKLAFAKSVATGVPYLHININHDDRVRDVLPKVFDHAIATLLEARNHANATDFEAAVHLLAHTQSIEIYGIGNSGVVARDAQLKFFRMGIPTIAYADAHLQAQAASVLNPEAVVLAISRTGRTRDLFRPVQLARAAGAKIIVISASGAPLAKLAHVHLKIDVREDPNVFSPMSSRLAQLALIDALAVAVVLLRGPQMLQMLERAKKVVADQGVMISEDDERQLEV